MNKQIQTQLDSLQKNLNLAWDFSNAYPDVVASETACFYFFDSDLRFQIRDTILAGKTFGTTGWTRKRDQYAGGKDELVFDWTKIIAGVGVDIIHAESVPTANASPVSPKAFPLELEDSK